MMHMMNITVFERDTQYAPAYSSNFSRMNITVFERDTQLYGMNSLKMEDEYNCF